MLKLKLLLLLSVALYADGLSEEALGSIYTEALWFVGVVAVMGVISFVVSGRQARKYEEVQRQKQETEAAEAPIERLEEIANEDVKAEQVDRLLELSKLLKEGLLSEDEFTQFKQKLLKY